MQDIKSRFCLPFPDNIFNQRIIAAAQGFGKGIFIAT
jgi:hypothetical protein